MKNLLLFFVFALMVVSAEFGVAATHNLSGPIDPIQATTNPANAGTGIGMITGDYDELTNLLNYSLEWSGITSGVTNMHFHLGAPGTPGGVELGVAGPWASPQIGSGISLNATQETNLLSGDWYLNIHTGDFGGGEIRGQVIVTPVPEPSSAGMLVGGLLSLLCLSRRSR